jgi:acyl carrier protein
VSGGRGATIDGLRERKDFLMIDSNKATPKAFLARFLQSRDPGDDEDIFALGFINSLFTMQLALFVEQAFGISVECEDLDLDNFRTINAIARFVERKSGVVYAEAEDSRALVSLAAPVA